MRFFVTDKQIRKIQEDAQKQFCEKCEKGEDLEKPIKLSPEIEGQKQDTIIRQSGRIHFLEREVEAYKRNVHELSDIIGVCEKRIKELEAMSELVRILKSIVKEG